MIYTVTFNPSLDYIVTVDAFELGKTNRTSSELLLPGGKGINVSIVLKNLGIKSTALGYVAGFTGEEIVRRLTDMGVHANFISLKEGNSRINVKVKATEETEINGIGPHISKEKRSQLMRQLEELKEGDLLVLAGSIPSSLPNDIYSQILAQMEGKGVKIIVDATKELLRNVLPYQPFLIKPNHHELGELFGVTLHTKEEIIYYGKKLQEQGACNVLISMGEQGAVLIAENQKTYSLPAPEGTLVNSVGAGDSMVAGFLAGWLERADYEYALRMGIAAGSASAFSELLATKEEIQEQFFKLEKIIMK